MATFIAKAAGSKLLEKHLKGYTPTDPLYETYTDEKGRQKRRKREIPPGLSKRDARILASVKKRAHRLDTGLNLCGFRVGWTFFVGMIPGMGDAINGFMGYYLIVRKAKQADIPPWLFNRMAGNQAIGIVVGFVPIAGDVAVAIFKPNSRNAALLEEFLRVRGEEFLKAQPNRVEDPKVVKPGAGKEEAEQIPGKPPSRGFSFFRRSSKKVPTTEDTPTDGEEDSKEKDEKDRAKSNVKDGTKGKSKEGTR